MSEKTGLGRTTTVHVSAASRSYDVHVGHHVLDLVGEVARGSAGGTRACVISDSNVAPLYAGQVEGSLAGAGYEVAPRLVFAAGEPSKNLRTLSWLLEGLAERELTRDDLVVAVGGGVVGDIAGLAAGMYLRGCKVVQVPTSLLAMVDSSVGGKCAVDLPAAKNLAGIFFQPHAVVADVGCLSTVDHALLSDSCGEVVKHAVLADGALLDDLRAHPLNERGTSPERLVEVVAKNVSIKRDVVDADERERGLRQTLNLGHTIGHAIEAASDFSLGHGSSVAAGLCMVARASARLGWSDDATCDRIVSCVAAHGLPTGSDLPTDVLMRYMAHDKKRHGEGVNLVVPARIAAPQIRRVGPDELRRVVELGREG